MTTTVTILEPQKPEVIEVGYANGQVTRNSIVAVDVQRRDTSFTMPTAAVPFVWNVVQTDTGGIYNPTTGVTTIPFTGLYTFNFAFSMSAGGGTDILYAFAQTSTDNGISWSTSTYSGRRIVISTQGQQILMASTNKFTQGTQLRFVFFSTDPTSTIASVNVPQSTAVVPASRLLITGISE